MKRLWIIFLALLVTAAFSKVEGTGFKEHGLFPLVDLRMIWPEYLYILTIHIAFVAFAWTLYSQEREYPRQLLVFAVLITIKLLDFVLRCNKSIFRIGTYGSKSYVFSYDSVMFLIFGMVILATVLKNE